MGKESHSQKRKEKKCGEIEYNDINITILIGHNHFKDYKEVIMI